MRRPRTPSPVPATVWIIDIAAPAGSERAGRLVTIAERVVTAFAPSGGAVAFLPWPATSDTHAAKHAGPAALDPAESFEALIIDTPTGAALVASARACGYTARMLTAPATADTNTARAPRSRPARWPARSGSCPSTSGRRAWT